MSQKIRILDVRDNPFLGGPSRGLFTTFREISSRPDVEVINCVLAREMAGWMFERAALEKVNLEFIHCHGPSDFKVLGRLERFIKENYIDIVHTRGYRGDLYIRTLLDLKRIKLPVVITKHGVQSSSHWKIRLYAWLDRRPLILADRTIAVDTSTYKMLLTWGVPSEKLELIPNPAPGFIQPTSEQLMYLRKSLSLHDPFPIIVFTARMEREKGIYDLLQAHEILVKQGKKVYLLYIGEGSCRLDIERRVELHPDKDLVRFLGMQVKVDEYLALSDIVILPSYKEGMPNSLLEAMSAGKPIIATRTGGIPDLIIDQKNGLLMQPGDVSKLAHLIEYLLDNPAIAKEMGGQGTRIATDEFSIKRAVDSIIKIYKEVIE